MMLRRAALKLPALVTGATALPALAKPKEKRWKLGKLLVGWAEDGVLHWAFVPYDGTRWTHATWMLIYFDTPPMNWPAEERARWVGFYHQITMVFLCPGGPPGTLPRCGVTTYIPTQVAENHPVPYPTDEERTYTCDKCGTTVHVELMEWDKQVARHATKFDPETMIAVPPVAL